MVTTDGGDTGADVEFDKVGRIVTTTGGGEEGTFILGKNVANDGKEVIE